MNALARIINSPPGVPEMNDVLMEAGISTKADAREMLACVDYANKGRRIENYFILCTLAGKLGKRWGLRKWPNIPVV